MPFISKMLSVSVQIIPPIFINHALNLITHPSRIKVKITVFGSVAQLSALLYMKNFYLDR
jgi:hypothetical protein